MPQFITAPQHNFETANLGIKLLALLAPDGWINLSDTLFFPKRASNVHNYTVLESLQGALSAFRGQSFEGHNSELMRAIDELLNATGW